MKKTPVLGLAFTILSLHFGVAGKTQNLLNNPSAETGAPTSTGWTNVRTGTNCSGSSGWRIPGNQDGYPPAQSGSYFFFPGCGGTGDGTQYEIYQDVNVSGSAAAIDAGKYTVSFSGYMQSFNQTPADQTQMIVEYRNGGGTVLSSYNTGVVASISVWTRYEDTRVAPVGTRTLRVRLISINRAGNAIDSYFDNLSLTAVSTLPLNFLSFSADNKANGNIVLHWKTANEINCKEFVVERSTGHLQFVPVAIIPAKGAAENEYSYQDGLFGVNNKNLHYRIRQVDNDNRFTYSQVIPVRGANEKNVQLLVPGPVKKTVQVLLKSSTSGKGVLKLIDFSGRTILTQNIPVNAGTNTVILQNTTRLPDGMYLLKLEYRGEVLSQKLMLGQ